MRFLHHLFVHYSNIGRRSVLGVPYLWLLIFFAIPFFILLRISLTDMGNQLDPFSPIVIFINDSWTIHTKIDNYISLFLDEENIFGKTIYIESYLLSFKYAFLTTLFCLLIGLSLIHI